MSVCSVLFLFVSAESHQVLAQLLDTLLVIGTQLPESPAVRQRLIEVACKVTNTFYIIKCSVQIQHYLQHKATKLFYVICLFHPLSTCLTCISG